MTHETEKTSAWAAERESRIPGQFYTGIEGLEPKEYSGVMNAAKMTTSDLLLVLLFYCISYNIICIIINIRSL
jgi:hypothetical protein